VNPKNRGFGDFLAILGCKGVNCDEMDGDRPRLPANMNYYRLSCVLWALARISCLTYRPSSFKHLSCPWTSFWKPDAKKNYANCCPSHWRMTDCASVSDANFCPSSIFLHLTCTVRFVKRLSPYIGCIWEWIWFALSLFTHKNNDGTLFVTGLF